MDNKDFLKIAEEFLKLVKGDLQPYTKEQIIIKKEGKNSVSMFAPSHIQFAKYGRGPGTPPPVDPILKWIQRKGIVTDQKEQLGTAFAISKSIGNNGTANYKPSAPDAILEAIDNHNDTFINKMAEKLSDKAREQIEDAIKIVFPDRITIKI